MLQVDGRMGGPCIRGGLRRSGRAMIIDVVRVAIALSGAQSIYFDVLLSSFGLDCGFGSKALRESLDCFLDGCQAIMSQGNRTSMSAGTSEESGAPEWSIQLTADSK